MAVDFKELVQELIVDPEKPLVGLSGLLAGATMMYGLDKASDLMVYGGTAGLVIAAGYCGARVLSLITREVKGLMDAPRVRNIGVVPYESCTGKTNTGHNAVIFISDYWNPNVDKSQKKAIFKHKREAGMMQRYLIAHDEFLGHPVDQTYLVGSAKANDVRDAFKDQSVSSVVLVGHSGMGSWPASDKSLGWRDIAGYVEEAGHCKDGFGFKTGCDVIRTEERDRYQILAPGYSHPGHDGRLYVSRGRPTKNENLLPGSRVSSGVEAYSNLFRLVPETA